MNGDKFDNFRKLLSKYFFKIDENVRDTLKCGKCQNLLSNSCTGPCLCKFCRHCLDEMLASGIEKCPGRKKECEHQSLSIFKSDNFTNFEISNLVMKCPNEMCPHECELINMEEHLRLCTNKLVTCPFYELGCIDEVMMRDRMHEHLQLQGYDHNKMLIDLINILRNEVNELKLNVERKKFVECKTKLEIFKDFLTRSIKKLFHLFVISAFVVILLLCFKYSSIPLNEERHLGNWTRDWDNQVQQLTVEINGKCSNDQIESIKMENQKLARQMETFKENLQSKTNGVPLEINNWTRDLDNKVQQLTVELNGKGSNDQIESIKMEYRELAQQMKTLRRNVDKKIAEKCVNQSHLFWNVLFVVVVNVCMIGVIAVIAKMKE